MSTVYVKASISEAKGNSIYPLCIGDRIIEGWIISRQAQYDAATHFLKPVDLPCAREIIEISENYSESYGEQCSFRDGINHILNLLNPTHNESGD